LKRIFLTILILLTLGVNAFATVDSTPQTVIYNTGGGVNAFTFAFSIDQASDIQVWYDQTLLTTSSYSVACSRSDCSTGGTVTTTTTYPSGHTITITTAIPLTQTIIFMENMPTLYKNFENGLDKLTRIAKQLILPVGSVYLSIYNTDPGTVLGYGTWSAQGTLTTSSSIVIYVFKRID
jgi:hypothetical protein